MTHVDQALQAHRQERIMKGSTSQSMVQQRKKCNKAPVNHTDSCHLSNNACFFGPPRPRMSSIVKINASKQSNEDWVIGRSQESTVGMGFTI